MRNLAPGRYTAAGPTADPLRTRRLFLGGLAAGVVAMSATGLAAVSLVESPGQVAARSAAPPRSVITAIARWEVLRDPIIVSGVVRAARTVSMTASAPFSTVTVTRMPVRVGERVYPGRIIAEVDGRPILLLRGRLPAYRDLHQGDSGPDVGQLQADLAGLGYADYDPPGYFGPSTSLALVLLYQRLGYTAPIYHPPGPRKRPGAQLVPDAYLPMSEVTYIPTRSALVVTIGARVGHAAGTGPLLRLATGSPYLSGVLSQHQASLARAGLPAAFTSAIPPLTGTGTVVRVGSMPAVGGPPPGGYQVRVSSHRVLPQRLVGARVRLTIWASVTSGPELAVPVSSIFAAARARHDYVTEVGPGSRRRRIPVFTGPAADGLVAVQPVRPGGLRPGDRVLIGYRR
ncbi:MAG TPA: hypothetical protein VLX31_10060 [Streptosporangiaceae bacterium]|nr:hypothetical protein [Streptosporangiaceae bacterium]